MNHTDGHSVNWLDGYDTIVLQRPGNDFGQSFQNVGARLRQYHFEVLLPEAWPSMTAEAKTHALVFTYSYVYGNGATIIGMFTDASTGHVVRQWRSSSRGEINMSACLVACIDDGMTLFEGRKGFDPAAVAERPLSWQTPAPPSP